jgi:hypothetical protein
MSELGPEAREILRNGRDGDDPLPADRARVHAALMAAIAAGAAQTIAGEASASMAKAGNDAALSASVGSAKPIAATLVGKTFAKGIIVLLLGAAGIGAWVAWPETGPSNTAPASQMIDKPAAAVPTAVEMAPPAPIADQPSEKTEDSPASALPPALPQKPTPARTAPSAAAPRPTEETADSLVAETQRLRDAHGALKGGDPEKALALLSDQAAEGEGQKLREERAAARVLALCKLGRVDEAKAEAAAFLAKNPRSPLADRVRKACPTSR